MKTNVSRRDFLKGTAAGAAGLLAALLLRSCAPPEAGIPALEPLLAWVTGKEVPLWSIVPIV